MIWHLSFQNEVHGPSDQVTDYRPGIKTTGQASSAHGVSTVPAAMRSSFAVGVKALLLTTVASTCGCLKQRRLLIPKDY